MGFSLLGRVLSALVLAFYLSSYGLLVFLIKEEVKKLPKPPAASVDAPAEELAAPSPGSIEQTAPAPDIPDTKEPAAVPLPAGKDKKKYGWWYRGNGDHRPVAIDPAFSSLIQSYKGIYQGNTARREIYLTFDEGYENGYTGRILDTLREENVPAAFFITGSYLRKNIDLVRRMLEEGHLVCNHSVNHYSMPELDAEKMKTEILGLAASFREMTGREMAPFFRPPMGEFSGVSLQTTAELGYYTVFWSFAYRDWEVDKQKGKEYAYQEVTMHCHPGAVLLLHAVSRDNAEALPDIIRRLKAEGYEFLPLDHIIE